MIDLLVARTIMRSKFANNAFFEFINLSTSEIPIKVDVWLRCKSAICRLNNDYFVCDTFDANRYRNL